MNALPTIPRTKYVFYEPVYLHGRAREMPASAMLFLWLGKRRDQRSMVTFEGRTQRDADRQMYRWIRLVKAKRLTKKQTDQLLDIYNGHRWAA